MITEFVGCFFLLSFLYLLYLLHLSRIVLVTFCFGGVFCFLFSGWLLLDGYWCDGMIPMYIMFGGGIRMKECLGSQFSDQWKEKTKFNRAT